MTQSDLEQLADNAAVVAGLDPALVKAIIEQESSWESWAWNPEPRYRFLMNVRLWIPFRSLTPEERASEIPPPDFPVLMGDRDQEWWGQQASWGLMQIIGGVARECGFKGPYLPELLNPEINLRFGCRHLIKKLKAAGQDVIKALLAWNGGGNPNYPQEVVARMSHYRV